MASSPLGNGVLVSLTSSDRKGITVLRGSVQALVQVVGANPVAYSIGHMPDTAPMIFVLRPFENLVLETQDQVECFRCQCGTAGEETQVAIQQFQERG